MFRTGAEMGGHFRTFHPEEKLRTAKHVLCASATLKGVQCQTWITPPETYCDIHRDIPIPFTTDVQGTLHALRKVKPLGDPLLALEEVGAQVMALVRIMQERVASLEKIRYKSGHGLEQIRGEIQIYLSALQRAESILMNIMKIDFEERRIRIEEHQVQFLVEAIERTFKSKAVKMTPAAQNTFRRVLMMELNPARRGRHPITIQPEESATAELVSGTK